MTYTNFFARSIGTAALTGALLFAPIAAIAQAPGTAPTPDEYAAQNPQYADQNNDQNNGQYAQQDPNAGQYGPQQGVPPNGAPQGIEQAPPPIPDYQSLRVASGARAEECRIGAS